MRNIDRFILHIVHNWINKLDEAYSEKAVQTFISKFKEEAEDFNIKITDNQLKAYIAAFDRIKEKLPSDQRDLSKWTLSKLIRLVTSSSYVEEEPEEIDITPDVVYHNNDNTIVIYNGSKEDNCILYGKGETWCITKGSFVGYRYNEQRRYPTFYLAKNNNLSDSNKLSFVAIQVRDPKLTSDNEMYVYTGRDNDPWQSEPMDFAKLIREVPWLGEIPNLRFILKYIPLSDTEKLTQQYKYKSIMYREWIKLPFSVKKQYLTVRKGKDLFDDISNDEFVEKYLSKYPELALYISITPGIIESVFLLKNLDKFSNQNRRSIVANLQNKVNVGYLLRDTFSFDIKKLLVQLNKWDVGYNERLYVTKDKDTIVKLELGDNIKINLYQAEDDFPNIKLNKRTSKYLLDYPELDRIPLENIFKLIKDNIVDKDLITKILDNARKNPNSALIINQTDSGEIILDSNSFSSYKVDKNNNIVSIPTDSEEAQQVFNSAKDNETFQQNALNLFKPHRIPGFVDKNSLMSVINAIPYNKRIVTPTTEDEPLLLLTAAGDIPFFMVPSILTDVDNVLKYEKIYGYSKEWFESYNSSAITDETTQSYFAYLRQINKSYNDEELLIILKTYAQLDNKKIFARNNPPVNETNRYKLAILEDTIYLVNTENPRESFQLSSRSGKLVKASIPSSSVRQLLGTNAPVAAPAAQQDAGEAPATPADQIRRRGRPPGGGQPRAAAPAAPAAPAEPGNLRLSTVTNQYNLTAAFNNLPRNILRRFNVDGRQVPTLNNRGASRRQNILGNTGRVIGSYEFGTNDIYIIRLANNTNVASLVSQPGNHHYLITSQGAFSLDSPANLLQALQQRNLAEVHRYIMNEYFERNPHHLNEFKQLLRKHINEKKNETK